MSERGSLLAVDDDPEVRATIRDYFEHCGFEVYVANDGEAMHKVLATRRIDLVLLDVNLPGADGLSLARELRSKQDIGIIILAGAGQVIDRIVGLEMGADDYVAKPFDPRELLARMKSVLRRKGKGSRPCVPQELHPEVVKMGNCTLDLAAHHLYDGNGEQVPLTSMEFDLLHAFVSHPDRVLSRSRLLELAHRNQGDVFDRSIDIRMARIRRKIEEDPENPQVLKTVRGAGYIYISGRKK
ncbi:MAG TPA: response regulator [Hypericibacter adhaerens]|jgi:two-component system phosphate regulon response regulator OmpR|uniref:response regulator n=1 Tax=Hypericibacter adhaerens TaxID=2602016 RepID=UPI002C922F7B|nr:response regulator [Hypericibacter adhaerens]HWA43914.1 response regulator [Hypericibacter adhaerens]